MIKEIVVTEVYQDENLKRMSYEDGGYYLVWDDGGKYSVVGRIKTPKSFVMVDEKYKMMNGTKNELEKYIKLNKIVKPEIDIDNKVIDSG